MLEKSFDPKVEAGKGTNRDGSREGEQSASQQNLKRCGNAIRTLVALYANEEIKGKESIE